MARCKVMKDSTVVTTITKAARDSSSLNREAIRRDNTMVGIAPSMKHEARAVPFSPKSMAAEYEMKGTTPSLMATAGIMAYACLTLGRERARPIVKIIRGTTRSPSIPSVFNKKEGSAMPPRLRTNPAPIPHRGGSEAIVLKESPIPILFPSP